MEYYTRSFLSLLAILPYTLAQTYTTCNPLTNTSCAANTGLSASSFSTDFTSVSSLSSDWTATSGSSLISYDSSSGAKFTISKSGDSPTIQTSFYVFFGTISVFLKSAPGTGIVSSIVLESDCLDEIDWEWIGGNTGSVQTNYFGKGNTTSYDRAIWNDVAGVQDSVHNYTVDWRTDATDWYIDSVLVRTLKYADAVGGTNYPQTPMRLKIGLWAGGDKSDNSEGTVTWAGGETDFSAGPFSMEVTKVEIANAKPAGSYKYSGQTGSWQSIEVITASATAQILDNSTTSDSEATSTATGESSSSKVTAALQTASSSAGLATSSGVKRFGTCRAWVWAMAMTVMAMTVTATGFFILP